MGKRTDANRKARAIIAKIAEEKGLDRCEVCGSTFGIAPAHRYSRAWYKGNVELLSAYEQWLCLCVVCHEKMDNKAKTTEEEKERLFKMLRKV